MNRTPLVEMVKHNWAHVHAKTVDQAESVMEVPVNNYLSIDRWRRECEMLFRRTPLMLAMSTELTEAGSYRALDVAGTPILIVRDKKGAAHAFVNMCSHRGAQLVPEGAGKTPMFVCPYHAWSYNLEGGLVGVTQASDFGQIDKTCHGLTRLPLLERAGLIWVIPDPRSNLDIADFLYGYDELLAHFGFENWILFERRVLKGPNWKVAFDGYLDFYHLPILHKNTFKDQFAGRALVYNWGPHQRLVTPDPSLLKLEAQPEVDWDVKRMTKGVWTIFPNTSLVSVDGRGKAMMISQIFPGETPEESYTIQNYVMDHPPTEEEARAGHEQFKLLEYVLEAEDYATGFALQKALKTGARPHVLFGRNEKSGQTFHRWIDDVLARGDDAYRSPSLPLRTDLGAAA